MSDLKRRQLLKTILLSASSAGAVQQMLAATFFPPAAHAQAPQQKKLAFAHYMTGKGTRDPNQSVSDWKDDIRDAMAYGIDGWQFNFGHFQDRFRTNVENFVKALNEMGSEAKYFYFFPSFDCNKRRSPELEEVKAWFGSYYSHPNHFRLNGLPLLTVWQARHVGNKFFLDLKQTFKNANRPISFIPWIACDPSRGEIDRLMSSWSSADGFFPWVPGRSVEESIRMNSEAYSACRKTGKTLMAGQGYAALLVNKAPRFRNKRGAEAITQQMLPMVSGKLPDCTMLNVATWNDFGEDHHITPYPPYPPKEEKYPVWCHIGYAEVLKYYLEWWKSGRQPQIVGDKLAIFHMTQLASEGRPPFALSSYGPDKAEDVVYVTAMLSQPGTVQVKSGNLAPVSFQAPAGISHWRSKAVPGSQMMMLVRDGRTLISHESKRKIDSPPTGLWTWSLYSEVATTQAA